MNEINILIEMGMGVVVGSSISITCYVLIKLAWKNYCFLRHEI